MAAPCSPLRYPGGKQILAPSLATLLNANEAEGKTYLEPYAGGAGAAFSLLFSEYVSAIRLNDADPAIASLWNLIISNPDAFIGRVRGVPLTIEEWVRQRAIYQRPQEHSKEDLGFSAFYLNRCNRSGIIANAGVIGGIAQKGKWKIDARFNRKELESRVKKISLYADRITIHNLDALAFLESFANQPSNVDDAFVYLDPPYYAKGSQLYLSYYSPDDHSKLANYLQESANFLWVLTYDDVGAIRKLYSGLSMIDLSLHYSAGTVRQGSEVLVCKPGMSIPEDWLSQGLKVA